MKREEMFSRVMSIIAEHFGLREDKGVPMLANGPVNDATTFEDDLGADSLDKVEMLMELEDAFDLHIPDEDIEKVKTMGELFKYLDSKLEYA